jgi:hypothetical protein
VGLPETSLFGDKGVSATGHTIPRIRIGPAAAAFGADASVSVLTTDDAKGIVVYAFRGSSCLGLIRLDGPTLDGIAPHLANQLLAAANLLVSVYELEFAFNLFGSIQEPLDFAQSDEQFFTQIALLIALSAGMEFVVLRELDDDRLRCIAQFGFGDEVDLSQFDLAPIGDFPAFAEALATSSPVSVVDIDVDEHAALRRGSWSQEPVRSFVATPVLVGTQSFGVLSVGARCPFEYAPLETRGFTSIANGVGVSIANFRNSHRFSGQVGEYKEAAVAITAVEIARAARHEAIGHIDNCNMAMAQLWRKLGKAPALEPDMDTLSDSLRSLGAALNKIKFATKPPSAQYKRVSVRRLWDEARNAVAGRLSEGRVEVRYGGPDVDVFASPDWFRQVFLNLLLNSIDAFSDAKKGGRRIELTVERPFERAREIQMMYRDNATGVNPQRLHVPPEFAEQPVHQQLFAPGVTSKRDGSGFGLWLVRRIMTDHHGSIDLTDYRGGVTFVIRVPKADTASAQAQAAS